MKFTLVAIRVLGRILAWSAALLLVAVVLLLLFFDAIAQNRLVAMSSELPGRLTVKKFRLTTSGLTLENVLFDFLNQEPVFEASEIQIDLAFWDALKGRFPQAVEGIRLEEPQLRVVVDENGELNLNRLLSRSTDTEGLDPTLIRGDVELTGGWIHYKDRRDLSYLYQLKGWNGHFRFPDGRKVEIQTSAHSASDTTNLVQLEGEVSLVEPSLGLEAEVKELGLLQFAGFPGLGVGRTQLEGEVSASARLQGRASSWDELPGELFVVGDIQLKDVRVKAPWMPVALENMRGRLDLLGDRVSTQGFQGQVLGVPFRVSGEGELGPEGSVAIGISVPRFSLDTVRSLVPKLPPEVKADIAADLSVKGSLADPTISGRVEAFDVAAQGQKLDFASADFFTARQLVRLESFEAHGDAGQIDGQGWVFLGEDPQVLLEVHGRDAKPDVVLPDLAQRADFHVKLLGPLENPVLYGQGDLNGLGSWSQGATSARGSFLVNGQDLFLYDSSAAVGSSRLDLPLASIDMAKRQLTGFMSTASFNLSDVPGLSGVTGNLSGSMLVSADLSQAEPRVMARGRVSGGSVSAAGLTVEQPEGEVFFNGAQLVVPSLSAFMEGSRFDMSGLYDTRDDGVELAARAEGVSLARFGLDTTVTSLSGTVSGRLSGELGVYGHAQSPQGEAALSAFRTQDGQYRGVAWVNGQGLRPDDPKVTATLVGSGSGESLDLEYNGSLEATTLAHLAPLQVFGGANLSGGVLRMRPTLLTARDNLVDVAHYPLTTYSGSAIPLFGPLLSGPLEEVVIEAPPYPRARSLTVAGDTDLRSGKLDMRFSLRAAGLEEFAELPLSTDIADTSANTLNDILPFQLLSAYGSARGRIQGRLGAPVLTAAVHLPWLLLANDQRERQSLSVRGRFELDKSLLKFPQVLVSENPFDSRLLKPLSKIQTAGRGLLALAGQLHNKGRFDVRMDASDFGLGVLAFFASQDSDNIFPYGRIATDNLHLWGEVTEPSVSGSVRLTSGGVRLAGEAFPLDQAHLDFSSQGRDLRVEDFMARAPGLLITGFGRRSPGGKLEGEVAARGVDFSRFHRLGGVVTGFQGQADLVGRVSGRYPGKTRLEMGFQTRDLRWNPAVTGGLSQLVSFEELALGRLDDQGALVEGAVLEEVSGGLSFKLPSQGFRLRTDGGLSLTSSGRVTWGPNRSETLLDYLASPSGPDFGQGEEAFTVEARGWTFRELSKLLGVPAPTYRAAVAATMNLQGQWWRDHARDSRQALPRYAFTLDKLRFEGGEVGQRSGFELAVPTNMVYQRQAGAPAGYLDLADFGVEFFREQVIPGPEGQPSTQSETIRGGVIEGEASLALTQLPGVEPRSSFNLAAVDIPLENMSFLLPSTRAAGGVVSRLEVNLDGTLPSPKLTVEGLASLTVGALQGMTLAGTVRGEPAPDGYQLSLNSAEGKPVTLTFQGKDPKTHRFQAEGDASLVWVKDKKLPQDRLSLVGTNLEISLQSPIELAAYLVDQNLEALAEMVPGKERTAGTLEAELNVGATLARPEFEGKATLLDGRFNSPEYGDFAGLQLDARLERLEQDQAEDSQVLRAASSGFITRLSLERFEGTLGGKPFLAGGKAELAGIAPTFLRLFFAGESLPLKLPNLFTGRADVELEVQGRVEESPDGPYLVPQLLGTLAIPQGDFTVPLGSVTRAEKESANSKGIPGEVALDISLGSEFYVRALDSTIRAMGDLRLITEQGRPRVYGQTSLSRGQIRIPFYDASFRVRQGMAIFDGPFMPRLDSVEAVADLGGYRIVAQADGRLPDNLKINLLSDPPLPQSELSRLVVLGGLPGQTGSGGVAGDPTQTTSQGSLGVLSGQGVSFLSGILTNRLTEQIGRIFFLSEISFDYIPPAQYVIKLAKALDEHDTFLLTLTRVIRDNGLNENLFGVEWRFARNLLVRLAFDQFAQLRFWFQSINRF